MRTLLAIFPWLALLAPLAAQWHADNPAEGTAIKLKMIILPDMVFKQTTLDAALGQLRKASVRWDAMKLEGIPAKKGLEFRDDAVLAALRRVKFDLRVVNTPVGEALRYIAESTGTQPEIAPDGVIVLRPLGAKAGRGARTVEYVREREFEGMFPVTHKMDGITLAEFLVETASPGEAAAALRAAGVKADTAELDPMRKGVNLIVVWPPGRAPATARPVSLHLRNVTLHQAVLALAKAEGMDVRVDGYAVVLTPQKPRSQLRCGDERILEVQETIHTQEVRGASNDSCQISEI